MEKTEEVTVAASPYGDDPDLELWAKTAPFRHAVHATAEMAAAAKAFEEWAARKGLA